ncbi:hypothetical protein VTG60DRAFT_6411 [Thermothelomyces hinnuleus]
MSGFGLPIPPFPTSKQSACDRCRSQKLRCPPREPGSEACSRCIRLGAKCETSYPRLPGRGGRSASSVSASQLNPKPRGPGGMHTLTARFVPPPDSAAAAHHAAAPSLTSVGSDHTFAFSLPEDSLDMFALTPLFDGRIDGLGGEDPAAFLDQHEAENDEDDEEDQVAGIESVMDTGVNTGMSVDIGVGIGSRLAHRRDHGDAMMLDTKAEGHPAPAPAEEPLASRLLADPLADLAEFLTIIQAYWPEPRRKDSNATTAAAATTITTTTTTITANGRRPRPRRRRLQSRSTASSSRSRSPGPPRQGMVATLHLIAVYLQLVAIYDRLFHLLLNGRLLFGGGGGGGGGEASSAEGAAAANPHPTQTQAQAQAHQAKRVLLPALAQLGSLQEQQTAGTAAAAAAAARSSSSSSSSVFSSPSFSASSSPSQRRGSSSTTPTTTTTNTAAASAMMNMMGGGLQTKILMHAILHQFETRQPAVAVARRESDGSGGGGGGGIGVGGEGTGSGGGGLLDDACASGLLDALCHETCYGDDAGAEDDHDRLGALVGLGALASLRGEAADTAVTEGKE